MYKVTVVTEGKEYPLLNQVLRLENPTLKEYINILLRLFPPGKEESTYETVI